MKKKTTGLYCIVPPENKYGTLDTFDNEEIAWKEAESEIKLALDADTSDDVASLGFLRSKILGRVMPIKGTKRERFSKCQKLDST